MEIKLIHGGFIIILIGILMLVLAISDAEWFWGNSITFNLEKIQGWINFFGRKPARIIAGIFSIFIVGFGIFWILVLSKQ